jgi:hypothetical protein
MTLVDLVALIKKIEFDMDSALGEAGKLLTSNLNMSLRKTLSGDMFDASGIK